MKKEIKSRKLFNIYNLKDLQKENKFIEFSRKIERVHTKSSTQLRARPTTILMERMQLILQSHLQPPRP